MATCLLESHAVVMSVTDEDDLIQTGTVVSSSKTNYAVLELLGKGGFGAVYRVCDQLDNKKVFAMKVEKKLESRKHSKLRMEIAILKLVCGEREHSHFTEIIDRAKKDTFFFLVMELVGKSLADLKALQPAKVFSPSTAFGVAIQCLEAVQDIHKHGFIHRDLKPGNYACGLNQRRRIIYLLDFGIARKILNENNELKGPRREARFKGTVRFASLDCHRNQELGFKDDCESWFYLLLDILIAEGLPWKKYVDRHDVQRCKEECRKDKRPLLFQSNAASKQLSELLDYIDSLRYHNTSINYNFMYEILRTAVLLAYYFRFFWIAGLNGSFEMEDLEPFNCYICSHPYDHLLRKPVKGICGHTICELCRKSVVVQSNSKCPFCKLDLAFLDKVGNWQLVDELTELVSNKANLIQDIRNVRRDYVSCERLIQDLAKSSKDTRDRQNQLISTLEGEVANLKKEITDAETSLLFQCRRCKVTMNKSYARLCAQCCTSKGLIKREKSWFRLNDVEQAWKEALCGGCILTSIHRGHSSVKLLNLYFTSEMHIKLEEKTKILQNLSEDKREETEMKMDILKQECKRCSTVAEGLKLIEEIDTLFEKPMNNTNDEIFSESLEIL